MRRNFFWSSSSRRCFSLFIVLLLLVNFYYSQAMAAAPVTPATGAIRVVMDNNYPPYAFLDNNGVIQGILADQWRLWQEKTGVRVELQAMDWKDALKGMKAGDFDVIDTAFITRDRLDWLDFGKPYARIEVSAFFNNELSGITDINSLRGFVVAVKEGDAAVDLLQSHGVDKLVFFKSYEAIIRAAKEHKVNVFVVDKPPALYFLYKYGIRKQYNVSLPFNVGEFHRAVRKGNTALLKEIESGFARISPEEAERIEKKWHGAPLLGRVSLHYLLVGTGISFFVILGLFYWNTSLRKAVKRRTAEVEMAELELRKSEAQYRELVESANSIILRRDSQGRISFINEFAQRFFGYQAGELIGKGVVGTIVPETDSTGKNLQAMIADIGLRPDHYATNENENMRRDGSRVWISWTNKPFYNAAGEVSEILSVGNDITRIKHVEEELRRRENQLQKILEILPLGLWFADKDGALLHGNPMGIKIWGAEPHVPISEYGIFKAWRLPSREPVKPEEWALAKTIRNGVTIVDELLEIESFDGKRKTVLNYTAPVLDNNGNLDGAIVVILDISDRTALEKQFRQAQKMESIGRLAGGVAHDFNNMLSVILGHTELALLSLDPTQPLFPRLQNIREAAQRSADLTQQLLAFARRQTVTPKVLDLNETLAGMLKMLRPLIGENIDLAWLPGRDPGPVKIDPSQIDQVLVNLCVNARDAIDGTGQVTIETGSVVFDETSCTGHAGSIPGEYVLLAVSDNGCGMDPGTLSCLFEPFFTTKKMGTGTGLGLATVYGIVKQNNGFINVYSETGQGTTFKIYLPRHATKAERRAQTDAEELPERGHETILLAEDEPLILEMTMAMLEPLGYTVLPATTPAEAIRLAGEHAGEIHLLITDVVMPGMNGRDLAGKLLSLSPNLKCLFMSGYTANVIAHQGVLDEGVHFIQKPFTLRKFAAIIREVLGRDPV